MAKTHCLWECHEFPGVFGKMAKTHAEVLAILITYGLALEGPKVGATQRYEGATPKQLC